MGESGGTLRASVHAIEVDAAHARMDAALRVGSYVRISISDTGCGMDAETLEQMFDPFFTTKPIGEGSGMGQNTIQKHQ